MIFLTTHRHQCCPHQPPPPPPPRVVTSDSCRLYTSGPGGIWRHSSGHLLLHMHLLRRKCGESPEFSAVRKSESSLDKYVSQSVSNSRPCKVLHINHKSLNSLATTWDNTVRTEPTTEMKTHLRKGTGCYPSELWPSLDSLTSLSMAHSSSVNVLDPAMVLEVPLCETFPFLRACCITNLHWVLFHIALPALGLLKLLSAQSSAWINPNYIAQPGNSHFSCDKSYLRQIKLWRVKYPN